ncbi:hemerythrin domain-containing protein, partial [Micromonospora sp. NPDC049799]|uniref:hemerythrin domain-containing protein n=1 Tax=Micromonospora sp. NPDC049799 TaxID=3154741 RepID=UPI0033FCAA75
MSASRSTADQQAAQAVVRHHAQLAADLDRHVDGLLDAADQGDAAGALRHRDELLGWLRDELLPHAYAEEGSLYTAAGDRVEAALLIRGMLDEHRAISGLVAELEAADRPVRLAAAARALAALFAVHLAKENDLIVPVLVDAPDVSLATLLDGMHDLLGSSDGSGRGGCGGGDCGCGGDQASADAPAPMVSIDPRLDVRLLPHHQRHARVLAALDALPAVDAHHRGRRVGGGLIATAAAVAPAATTP